MSKNPSRQVGGHSEGGRKERRERERERDRRRERRREKERERDQESREREKERGRERERQKIEMLGKERETEPRSNLYGIIELNSSPHLSPIAPTHVYYQ